MNFHIRKQELKNENTRRSNDIARRKNEVSARCEERLAENEDRYHEVKREALARIAEIRLSRQGFALDDPQRSALTDQIRNIENELSLARDERDIKMREIRRAARAEMRLLDEEARILAEWYDRETVAILTEEMQSKEVAALVREEQALIREEQAAKAAEEGGEQ